MLKLAICIILAVCAAPSVAHISSELCENGQGKFDTIFSTADDKVYIIKGSKFWELDGNKDTGFQLKPGYPRRVSDKWAGLPPYLDTAFTDYKEGKTYFMKGTNMWVYNGEVLEAGGSKPISSQFHGIPGDLDGAFMCTGVNYFFKGNKYYTTRGSGPIAQKWRGLPDNMHASIQFSSRGHTFFFKDYQFYKYRVWNGPVESGYPKSVVPFWFQCDTSSDYGEEPENEPEINERLGNP